MLSLNILNSKKHFSLCLLASFFFAQSSFAKSMSHHQQDPNDPALKIETDFDLEKIKKESLSIKKLGSSYRVRFLENKDQMPEGIYKLKAQTNKLHQAAAPSKLGPGSTGGGFTNYRGGLRNLALSVAQIKQRLRYLPKESFDIFLSKRFQGKISRDQILAALDRIEYSYYIETISVDPQGRVDNLDADFEGHGDSGHILLMKDFFAKYGSGVLTEEFFISITRTILHEITHLYGVGLTDDEESYKLSFEMTEILFGAGFHSCGSYSNITEGIKSCVDYFAENKKFNNSAQDSRVKLIHDFHFEQHLKVINQEDDGKLFLLWPIVYLRSSPGAGSIGRIIRDISPASTESNDYIYPYSESLNSSLWRTLWWGQAAVYSTKDHFELETSLTYHTVSADLLTKKTPEEVKKYVKQIMDKLDDTEFGLKKNSICESLAGTLGNSGLGNLKWRPKLVVDWLIPNNENQFNGTLLRTSSNQEAILKVVSESDFSQFRPKIFAIPICVADKP